jgi:hypothetical protein
MCSLAGLQQVWGDALWLVHFSDGNRMATLAESCGLCLDHNPFAAALAASLVCETLLTIFRLEILDTDIRQSASRQTFFSKLAAQRPAQRLPASL